MTNSHLIDFIQSFNQHEVKVTEEYLEKMAEPQELRLFKTIVLARQKISDKELIEILVIDKNELQRLKSNLFDNISEALISDKHIKNEEIFNNNFQMAVTLNKKLILIKIIFKTSNQGRDRMLKSLIEETIGIAKENEIYNVLADAYKYKKNYTSGQSGHIQQFNRINELIEFYDYCYKALFFASDCYHRLMFNDTSIKSLSKNEFREQVKTSIQQMEKDYKKTKSQQINYYLNFLKVALSEYDKKYLRAISHCNKLIGIIKRSKVVYQKERLGTILINLSQFKTYTGKYKEAILDARKSQKYHITDSLSHIINEAHEFHACFYGKEYEHAEKCISEILKHPVNNLGEFRYATYVYYQCCNLFALKKYKEAAVILSKPLEIEKDKSRWNIGIRILTIMLFVELDRLDEASLAVESLRKYMERITKNEEVEARTILIVKLLRELEKNEFVYDPKNTAALKLLKTLSAKNKPTSWEHYTSELVKFHEWVAGRIL